MDEKKKRTAAVPFKVRQFLMNIAPLLGLVLIFLFFAIATGGATVSSVNFKILTNQVIITGLVAIGAVFAFASGALDMSLGGSVCLTAISGALIGNITGSFVWMLVTCVAVSMILAVFKGIVAACLQLPVFIVTIIFGSVLSAVGLVLLGKETTLSVSSIIPGVVSEHMMAINLIFLVGFFLVALVIFNYTKIGKSAKLVGGNPVAAAQSGINIKRNIVAAFIMTGIGATLASIIVLFQTKTATAATGGTIGTDVMVAIVLGGMPLSGGPRSRISAGLIGAATITILNNGLAVMGLGNDIIQLVRGVIFLIVVFITSMTYRTKLLPR